jgi:hypothetical protein
MKQDGNTCTFPLTALKPGALKPSCYHAGLHRSYLQLTGLLLGSSLTLCCAAWSGCACSHSCPRKRLKRGFTSELTQLLCCFQQWHLWLVDPPPSACEIVGRVVELAAIWAMEQGRKRLWSSTSFWSALHDFARHDRPVPVKGWDEVGPDHPFLSVRI